MTIISREFISELETIPQVVLGITLHCTVIEFPAHVQLGKHDQVIEFFQRINIRVYFFYNKSWLQCLKHRHEYGGVLKP